MKEPTIAEDYPLTLISTCSLHRDIAHEDSGVISAQIQPIVYAGRGILTSKNLFEEVKMAYLHLPLTNSGQTWADGFKKYSLFNPQSYTL